MLKGETVLEESRLANPQNPYGTARSVQRSLVEMYHHHFGLDILHTRSFNHFGPYQTAQFVLASFAQQLAQQYVDGKEVLQLSAGNVEISRDFTYVGDVVEAYLALFKHGKAGETYNVCSGEAVQLSTIIEMMGTILGKKVEIEINPDLFRPSDNMIVKGSHQKINRDTGWKPNYTLEQSLKAVLDFWIGRSQHLIETPSVKNNRRKKAGNVDHVISKPG